MMWRIYRHIEEDYAIYKEALNQATAEIGISKRNYEQKIAFIRGITSRYNLLRLKKSLCLSATPKITT